MTKKEVASPPEHHHCPDGCEKAQPFIRGGVLYCGRCWFKYGEMVPMVLCTPETCPGEAAEDLGLIEPEQF